MQHDRQRTPWAWVPSLYFAEGLPYVIVITLSVVMYKQLGLGNAEVAYYTGWFYLPWLIKPLWSPFVDLLKTKRWWIVGMQLLMGVGMAGIAFTLPMASYLQWTLAIFWLMAFSSATHDVAADGFYMMALDEGNQSFFVGIRSTFYRLATLTAQGGMLILVDWLMRGYGNEREAWITAFFVVAVLFVVVGLYHAWQLPRPSSDVPRDFAARDLLKEFGRTFVSFFQKEGALPALLFMLLFRFPEAQLAKMGVLFLMDPASEGGLGLTLEQIGVIQGTLGPIGLTLWRHSRWGVHLAWRTQALVVANGVGHIVARYRVCIPQLCAARKSVCNLFVPLYRTVGLWLWIYGLYALPYILCARNARNRPLCYCYGFYGCRYDAAWHDGGSLAGVDGLLWVLHLGDGLLCCYLHCVGVPEN